MRWLIVGSGRIANTHVEHLAAIDPQAKFARLSTSQRAPTFAEIDQKMSRVFFSWDDALEWKPSAAVVANSTSAHVASVMRLIRCSIPTFVEKPISTSSSEVHQLLDEVERGFTPVLVGYCLRYDSSLRYLKDALERGQLGSLVQIVAHVGQHIDDWRPDSSEPIVSLNSELGGGVLLELSHEIDLCIWLLGVPTLVTGLARVVEPWSVEMAAGVLMAFQDTVASVSLNMFEKPGRRTFKVVGVSGTIQIDLQERVIETADIHAVTKSTSVSDRNQMYRAQMEHFVNCVKGTQTPLVSVREALEVVKCIEMVKKNSGF